MGFRWWSRIFKGMDMAGIKLDPDQYVRCTDYFEPEQWDYFQGKLNNVGFIYKDYCEKYKFKPIRDSRWPTRGFILKKCFNETRIRLILNAHYIDELSDDYGKEFYELCVSNNISISQLFKKTTYFKKIKRYEPEQLNDKELITRDLESLVNKLITAR